MPPKGGPHEKRRRQMLAGLAQAADRGRGRSLGAVVRGPAGPFSPADPGHLSATAHSPPRSQGSVTPESPLKAEKSTIIHATKM